ncbi:hypothetical protein ACSBR2_038091 [Camellia fascicularis]
MNQLQAQYFHPNEDAIRVVLRCKQHDCYDLLNYEPTYQYSTSHKSKVADFLSEPFLPSDPTVLDVLLISLIEEEDMKKQNKIKNMMVASSRDKATTSTTPLAQTAEVSARIVLALASTVVLAVNTKSHQASKRACIKDPSVDLTTELSTNQLVKEVTPVLAWKPSLTYRGKMITTAYFVAANNEHLLGDNLSKALLLPTDMEKCSHYPYT